MLNITVFYVYHCDVKTPRRLLLRLKHISTVVFIFLINLEPNTYPVNSLNLLKNSWDWNLIGSYNIRDQIVKKTVGELLAVYFL